MITVLFWSAPFLALAAVTALARSFLAGHDQPVRHAARYYRRAARYHLTRHRTRRMRGPLPARDQGIAYDRLKWLAILDTWEEPAARPERTRT